jgi:Transposase DDE domain.
MVVANIKIISGLKQYLERASTKTSWKMQFTEKSSDFTRERQLTFKRIVGLLINLPKRSLSIEVREFFDNLSSDEHCSKSAFCMQRSKLKPAFFQKWNQFLVRLFYYHHRDNLKRWKGYLIQAVDGSTVCLPDKEDVVEYFGVHENQHTSVPMARIMQVHDVLNNIIVWGDIYPIKRSENSIIEQNLHQIPRHSITLFDRGFPSFALIYLLEKQLSLFVIRAKVDFNLEIKKFVKSSQKDIIIYFSPNKKAQNHLAEQGHIVCAETKVKVRLIKVILPSGEVEVLITNLFDEQLFPTKAFSSLYSLRWGIETCYGIEKNQQQMEIFSGHRVVCILQDYYATVFVHNMQSLIEKQSQSYLAAVSKKRKYEYKINRNISWAILKNTLFKVFIIETDTQQMLLKMQSRFEECLEPARPNRKAKRMLKQKRRTGKYQHYTNYKRAI